MDREAIARKVRRRQAQESLDFERDREKTIQEQIEYVIAEADGRAVDEAAYAKMAPEDAAIVRKDLNPLPYEPDATEYVERDDLFEDISFDDPVDPHAEELARLSDELEDCRRRQQAFESYIAALGG